VEPDIHERFQEKPCRRSIAIRECGAIEFTVAAKQFVGKHIHPISVDRLPSDECLIQISLPNLLYRRQGPYTLALMTVRRLFLAIDAISTNNCTSELHNRLVRKENEE